MISYWRWLFLGSPEGRAGWKKFRDWWMFVHIGSAAFLGSPFIESSLQDVAKNFLLPLAAVLVGLTFAWSANAQLLLQTEEIESFATFHKDSLPNYVYTYQTAMLVVIATVVLWGLATLGIFDKWKNTPVTPSLYWFIKAVCYFFASLSLRECWHVIFYTNYFLLLRSHIKQLKKVREL